jgi:predicted nucleic acid-binding protein
VIYLDTSVVLAHLLAEDRSPPPSLWDETLVSSRLLEYEVWTRIHALGLAKTHAEVVQAALDRVSFLELSRTVLARALEPFPIRVQTLDALHLAAAHFLNERGQRLEILTYDDRMAAAARRMSLPLSRFCGE